MHRKPMFTVFVNGWWSTFRIPGGFEVDGVNLSAFYNRIRSKAKARLQKDCLKMIADFRKTRTSLFAYEYQRRQSPVSEVKWLLAFLKHLPQLTLVEIGCHVLDIARFYHGESQSLYCLHHRTRADILAEIMMMKLGAQRSALVI